MAKMTVTATINGKQKTPDAESESSKVAKKLIWDIKKTLEYICRTAIDHFYEDYPEPYTYKRKLSLYEMYRIVYKNGSIGLRVGGELSNTEHNIGDNDYIFDVMFKLGQHGGAKPDRLEPWMSGGADDYYWRYPSPGSKAEIGGIPAFSEWYKDPIHGTYKHEVGFPAPRAKVSPYKEIKSEVNNYVKGELQEMISSAITKLVADAMREG